MFLPVSNLCEETGSILLTRQLAGDGYRALQRARGGRLLKIMFDDSNIQGYVSIFGVQGGKHPTTWSNHNQENWEKGKFLSELIG